MDIIVSDLEGTLTTGSSWRGLRSYFKNNYNTWTYNRFFLKWLPKFPLVQLGILDRRKIMSSWMQEEIGLLRGASPKEINDMAEWIVEHSMWPDRREAVLAELDQHHQAGTKIVVVSSAYQPIVEAFARRMDAIPVGSPLVFHADKLMGVSLPINSYEHKRKYIETSFNGYAVISAYGDTASDIAMMEMSQEPVAVFPDSTLRRIAETKNWRIIDIVA